MTSYNFNFDAQQFLWNILVRGLINATRLWLSFLLTALLIVLHVVNERFKVIIAKFFVDYNEIWPETIDNFSGSLGNRLLYACIPICLMVYLIDFVKKKHFEYDYQMKQHYELYKKELSCISELRAHGIDLEENDQQATASNNVEAP